MGHFTSLDTNITGKTKKYEEKKKIFTSLIQILQERQRNTKKKENIYLINEINQFRLCWVLAEGAHHTLVKNYICLSQKIVF